MKGIILAGGSGTRLYPLTTTISKQLLPIYNKPMIYYPLSVLMLAGIREILIISTQQDLPRFQELLGDGSNLGLSFSYAIQEQPNGIAEAFIIGEEFIGDDSVSLILGDNLFYGSNLSQMVQQAAQQKEGATVFGYHVNDPERFGVIGFNDELKITSIEEKPSQPKSNYAVTGLYFYDNRVINYAKQLRPSARGELEITDINRIYLDRNQLHVQLMDRGFAWLDTGTHASLLAASEFIHTVETRQNLMVACPEEISYRMGYITKYELKKLAEPLLKNDYGKYLLNLIK
ncbi:glucose-1-phosphate thymidylyltransferase RfbA [Atopobacter phocae]|uniref:glucose-1-phosphate thymidylyltransferase RfbA n=1 Tax=Atopobacter phocae TaxID=136492 RepID=UPI0004718D0A|nr:glucose-1-phosphate thymidylyltransferase RfbA [Atopobacter phocae]